MSPNVSHLLELFAMAEMNDAKLDRAEKLDLLKAKLAVEVFERAMLKFTKGKPKAVAAAPNLMFSCGWGPIGLGQEPFKSAPIN